MRYLERLMLDIGQVVCYTNEKKYYKEEIIEVLVKVFLKIKKERHMLFFIGNGGSAGIAGHMTIDYLKNGGMKTHSMLDASTITCIGNDFGYEYIFSKQLEIVAEKDDVLIAISSSGNSENIINAVEVARERKCKIITLSGFREDNSLCKLGDYNIHVPSMEYGIVESIHNMILQQIVDEIVAIDGIGLK